MRHANAFDPAWVRRNLVLTLVVSIDVANSFIIFPDDESRLYFSNWTINAAAAAALRMSLVVVRRQKLDGLHSSTYVAFAAGLALYCRCGVCRPYFYPDFLRIKSCYTKRLYCDCSLCRLTYPGRCAYCPGDNRSCLSAPRKAHLHPLVPPVIHTSHHSSA